MSQSVIDQIRAELVSGIRIYERRHRRRRGLAMASVVVVTVLVSGLALRWRADDDARTHLGVVIPAVSPLPGLNEIPPPPPGLYPTQFAWTGGQLIVTFVSEQRATTALAYNVDTASWLSVPDPPIQLGEDTAVAWTESELIACCAFGGTDAAAYDPATSTWRSLPDAPISGPGSAVWTGKELIVVAEGGAASFDPSSSSWRSLPPSPTPSPRTKTVWTGTSVIAWPAPSTRTTFTGSSFDPATDTWTMLPSPPEHAWPAIPDIAWLGNELVLLGGLPGTSGPPEHFVAARYAPAAAAWTPLPAVLPEPQPFEGNLGSHTTLWTGNVLLVHVGALASGVPGISSDGALLAYSPQDDTWRFLGKTSETALRPIGLVGDRVMLTANGRYFLSDSTWNPLLVPSPTDDPDIGTVSAEVPDSAPFSVVVSPLRRSEETTGTSAAPERHLVHDLEITFTQPTTYAGLDIAVTSAENPPKLVVTGGQCSAQREPGQDLSHLVSCTLIGRLPSPVEEGQVRSELVRVDAGLPSMATFEPGQYVAEIEIRAGGQDHRVRLTYTLR